jgi:hypothetical protein
MTIINIPAILFGQPLLDRLFQLPARAIQKIGFSTGRSGIMMKAVQKLRHFLTSGDTL